MWDVDGQCVLRAFWLCFLAFFPELPLRVGTVPMAVVMAKCVVTAMVLAVRVGECVPGRGVWDGHGGGEGHGRQDAGRGDGRARGRGRANEQGQERDGGGHNRGDEQGSSEGWTTADWRADSWRGGEWRWCAPWDGATQEDALWEDGRTPTWTPTTGTLPADEPGARGPVPTNTIPCPTGGELPVEADAPCAGRTTSWPLPSSSGGVGSGCATSSSSTSARNGGDLGSGLHDGRDLRNLRAAHERRLHELIWEEALRSHALREAAIKEGIPTSVVDAAVGRGAEAGRSPEPSQPHPAPPGLGPATAQPTTTWGGTAFISDCSGWTQRQWEDWLAASQPWIPRVRRGDQTRPGVDRWTGRTGQR